MKIKALNYDKELVYIIHIHVHHNDAYAVTVNPKTGKLRCSNIIYLEIIDEEYIDDL